MHNATCARSGTVGETLSAYVLLRCACVWCCTRAASRCHAVQQLRKGRNSSSRGKDSTSVTPHTALLTSLALPSNCASSSCATRSRLLIFHTHRSLFHPRGTETQPTADLKTAEDYLKGDALFATPSTRPVLSGSARRLAVTRDPRKASWQSTCRVVTLSRAFQMGRKGPCSAGGFATRPTCDRQWTRTTSNSATRLHCKVSFACSPRLSRADHSQIPCSKRCVALSSATRGLTWVKDFFGKMEDLLVSTRIIEGAEAQTVRPILIHPLLFSPSPPNNDPRAN